MFPTKAQCETIIGHSIRQDTYQFMMRMDRGEKYEDIYEDLDKSRIKYGFKKDMCLCKEKTALQNLNKVKEKMDIFAEAAESCKEPVDEPWKTQTGIYGIYINDELIYIGKTMVSFRARFQSHVSSSKETDVYLYRLISKAKEEGKQITMKPLIIIEELKIDKRTKISDRDLCCMELALIELYKPIGNMQGRIMEYQF